MPTASDTTVRRDVKWLQGSAPELISRQPIAEVLDTDRTTVDTLIANGTLPSVRLKRRVLIPRQAVLDLLRLPRIDVA